GVIRQAVARGAYYPRARYDYAGTYTAAGHATLFTGVLPRVHGIVANEVWDAKRAKVVSAVDDAQHAVVGTADRFASPSMLRAPTVADELERVTHGRALTLSISLKDRAAVLPGGRHADLALFYDTKRGLFTTSTWYAGGVPSWLGAFQAQHPITASLGVWEPYDSAALARLLGPDAATGESDWQGLGNSFPHDPRRSPEPTVAVRATPFATEYLLDVARAGVRALGLGADEVPDLLMLSLSSVDYAGHLFGGESWEYADNLVRADRALTRFLRELPAETRVILSSDHGAAPLPERSLDRGKLALRIRTKKVARAVNKALAGRFQLEAPPVASYTEPFIYLTDEAKSSAGYDAILGAVESEVGKALGVAAVYRVRDLVEREPVTELETLVRASLTDDAAGDLFVVPSELSVVDPSHPGGTGTSHGSPWSYDRFVPVLFWGPGVTPHAERGEVPVLAFAPTLAALLGIRATSPATVAPLAGAP
ncbi:MAG TPA: alkaline phosphatase family protein, partial [Polyangiaceae bacterium]|nr:alkaline phosphatase family protein [Polyangiaceae bacterium]